MQRIVSAFSVGRGAASADAGRRRNLLALSLAGFLASVGFMVVMPSLPGLIRDVAGGDGAQTGLWLGLAISVSPLLTAITGPFWVVFGERYGRKAMIQRSIICIGIGVGLLAVAASPIHVVLLRGLIGALGGISIATLAAATAITPRRELGPVVGTLQAAQTAGAMVGPLIGGLLGGLVGMRESFVVSAGVFVCALGLFQWLYRETGPVPVENAPRAARGSSPRAGLLGAGAVVALVAAFTVQFVEGGLIVLLPLELERLGVAPESLPGILGVGFSATYLAATIAAAVGGRLAAKRPPLSVLCVVLLLGLAALVPLAFAQTWWQFVGLRVLLALAVGAAPTLLYAAAATLAPPDQRGKLVGMVSSAGIFGWAASPLAAGALAHEQSTILLSLDAGLYALLALVLLAAERGLLDRLGRSRPTWPPRPALRPHLAVPRGLLGRLSGPALALPGRSGTHRFTADEVIAVLRGTARGERADAVLDVASRPSVWMPADPRRVFGDAPRYADRLPTILHWYRAGDDPETIGRRLSPLGGRWAVERTVETAAGLIAAHLNR